MDTIFLIKLAVSFVVGGSVLAGLGWLAEHAPRHIAGLILSLPSTVVISFFFIGWTSGIDAIITAVPATVATAAAIQLYTIVYFFLSRIQSLPRLGSIIMSVVGALGVWFLVAVPIAILRLTSLSLALALYGIATMIAYYFLTIRNQTTIEQPRYSYTTSQKIGRVIFTGMIISLAVFLAKMLSPFWGGIFSSFPAVFTSSFIIMHWYRGHPMIAKILKTTPAGSLIFMVFELSCLVALPRLGLVGGIAVSYAICLILFFFTSWARQRIITTS